MGARRWVRAEVGEGAGAGEGSGCVEEGDASGHGAAFAEVSAHLERQTKGIDESECFFWLLSLALISLA